MRVKIDRNHCGSWGAACEECFSVFIAHNYVPDRGCIIQVEDDGSPNINAEIQSGQYTGTLTITPENREAVMREGWRKFSTLPDEAFDIKPPTGDELRAMRAEE